jgi:alkylation response protein AidB-like acyl-CoA dehydrogenase
MDAFEAQPAPQLAHLPRHAAPEVLAEITRRLAETAADYDKSGAFPAANFALLHQHGLVGLPAVRRLLGDPLTLPEARAIIAAVARGEPSTALILVMTYLYTVQIPSNPHWPEGLKQTVLEDIALRGALINALRVEPELGTPVRGGIPDTVARRVPGGWRISGRKLYSTGAPGLTWLAVWGRSDDAEPLIGTFLVPADSAGISIEENWDQLGMRATASHDVILDDVFILTEYAVDIRTPKAWEAERPAELMAWMAALLPTIYDSVARNARDWLIGFAHTRKPSNLGAALATLAHYQAAIGEIDSLLFVNQTLLDRATQSPGITPIEANFIKYHVTHNAIKITEKALALTGNPALSRANPLERFYRDTLSGRVHSPQDDIILTGAGRFALAT